MTATSPWYCAGRVARLPRFNPVDEQELSLTTGAGVLRALADLIHHRPRARPFRRDGFEERCAGLLCAVAGYPEVADGVLPHEEPLGHRARLALALALQLDTLSPISGDGLGSLRAELLWLDRVRRSSTVPAILALTDRDWFFACYVWLVAGVGVLDACEPGHVFLNVCWDASDGVAFREVRRAVAMLRETQGRLAQGLAVSKEFARPSSTQPVMAAPQYLVWAASGRAIVRGRSSVSAEGDTPRPGEPAPKAIDDAAQGSVEVRFRSIQAWMLDANRHPRFGPTLYRGSSLLLEAALSQMRRALISGLGPGRLIVDGGGRLRFLCSIEEFGTVKQIVHASLEALFHEASPLGRRLDGASLGDETTRTHLAAGVLPAWTCVFRTSTEFDEGAGEIADAPVPERRRVDPDGSFDACPLCGPESGADEGERGAVAEDDWIARACAPCRVKMLIGRQVPRDRVISIGLAQHWADSVSTVAPPREPLRQLLALDLNRVGALFTRARQPDSSAGDVPGAARRSFRFTAHWLLAVGAAFESLRDEGFEPLVIGGDDLVVGCRRLDVGRPSLLRFVDTLHQRLDRFREELPPCDQLSFAAGLAVFPDGENARGTSVSIRRCLQAERWAKLASRDPADFNIVPWPGAEVSKDGVSVGVIGERSPWSYVASWTGAVREGSRFEGTRDASPSMPRGVPWRGSVDASLADVGDASTLVVMWRDVVIGADGGVRADRLLVKPTGRSATPTVTSTCCQDRQLARAPGRAPA